VTIPRCAIHASAGGGSVVLSEEVEDYFTVSHDCLSNYLPKGAKGGIIEARGDSMEPTIADECIAVHAKVVWASGPIRKR